MDMKCFKIDFIVTTISIEALAKIITSSANRRWDIEMSPLMLEAGTISGLAFNKAEKNLIMMQNEYGERGQP